MAKHTLIYPGKPLRPEDLLNFIELDPFVSGWKGLGLDDEETLTALQISIMCNPTLGDVIRGTGGLRKLRYSPPGWKSGKSGALRVCYVYFRRYGVVLLVTVYPKTRSANLSEAGKHTIRKIIERIKKALKQQHGF